MLYSLTNVPTVIRDLARLPSGPALTADLLQAFAMTPPDLEVLDARVPARTSVRSRAVALVGGGPSGLDVTIGGMDDLVRFVRHDVLASAWTHADGLAVAVYPAAIEAVTDGVVATYTGRADIGRAWRNWCAVHPQSPPAVPYPLIVDVVRRLVPPARVPVVPAQWSQLMHEACWAVHLAGRERAAAVTQLAALQALFEVTKPAAPSPALVATVVAAVHAGVASDLLAADDYDAMTQPLFSLLP
ncbi:MAG: hypothetical protein QOC82_744 [Frankiaceae bacterium]|jgi:hypothetical protein|nr:hypothetical protein [Frankiaceae bacterium]